MKTKALHNIICFEGEWLYNADQSKDGRFNLNTSTILNCLKDFYDCDIIYRRILTKQDLEYYIHYFATHKAQFKQYDIIYFAFHGRSQAICLQDGDMTFADLARLSHENKEFLEDKIIHFSSCGTLWYTDAVENFKKEIQARLVSGYEKSVDATKSAILDMAYFDYLLSTINVGIVQNIEVSSFYKIYGSLIEHLRFRVI